jgi:O-succinylhomoserine sulfhydrylase
MRASFAEEKDRNIYSRYSNPNNNEFISKVCAMEGAAAGFAFASGMAAVYSTMAAIKWDHIVSSSSVLVQHTLFINYFQNGTYKPRILTSINLRLLKV